MLNLTHIEVWYCVLSAHYTLGTVRTLLRFKMWSRHRCASSDSTTSRLY